MQLCLFFMKASNLNTFTDASKHLIVLKCFQSQSQLIFIIHVTFH